MSKPLQCFVCVFEDGFARLLQNLERLSGNLKWWRMHKITVKEFVKKRSPESILYLFQAAKKVSASNLSSGESFSASRALIEIWRSRKKNLSAQQVWKSSSLHSYVPKLFSHSSSKDLLPLKNVVVWHLSSPTFSYFCDCMPPTFFAFMHLFKYTFWKWPFHCFHHASLCSIYYLV